MILMRNIVGSVPLVEELAIAVIVGKSTALLR
jgi:hypothetical protein